MTPYRVPLAARLVDSLANQAPHLPDAAVDGDLLDPDVNRAYQALRATAIGAEDLWAHCKSMLDGVYLDGFVIIEAAPLLDLGPEHGPRAATALLTWLATPLNVLDATPLWKPLGTDPEQVTSTGYQPFQIDIVNATRPPDYLAQWCLRPDPRGGGHTLISHLRRAVLRLDDEERRLLTDRAFTHGDFAGLRGVGDEYRPFPVLDGREHRDGFVRFDARILPGMDSREAHTSAARALEREVIAGQRRFLLARGDLIVINQHVCAHGRERLGPDQATVHDDEHRMLHQMFLRARRGSTHTSLGLARR
ncbi:TauD/TfdA family dioxygenase [Streptomyces alboflavus]|uniref:TauD/TfdA family dioxygenase n=1 Tax=Streptomyces alboflavus TaxID=67267 RepID=UPI000F657A9B|nr:TauD/TfdA family dioxygenase [Streptomyces alboflavus]